MTQKQWITALVIGAIVWYWCKNRTPDLPKLDAVASGTGTGYMV